MIRLLDLIISFGALLILSPMMILVFLYLLVTEGCPLFVQQRVGRYERPFYLYKYRTMVIGSEELPTHLMNQSNVTPFGSLLRRTKFDELPQLWNVLRGDMSLVGARPCLYSQISLLRERRTRKLLTCRPGITGVSQINNIDMSTPRLLSRVDALMMKNFGVCAYFSVIFKTVAFVLLGPIRR